MAYTQADLDSINTAIKGGAKRVRLNGREQEMFSMDDLLKAKADIVNDLARIASNKRPRSFRARTSKGL